MAHQPLVAGEQPRNVLHGRGTDAEEPAGNVHGFAQATGPRHVHAVVVLGRQVHRGEKTAVEDLRRSFVAQQFGGGERLPLGLEDAPDLFVTFVAAVMADRSALADAAVGGHQQRIRVGIGHPYTGFQFAGKERVERGVRRRVGLLGFAEVDPELSRHRVDQPCLQLWRLRIRQPARQRGQGAVREDVGELRQQAHGALAVVRAAMSAASAAGSIGSCTSPDIRPCGSRTAMEAL